MSDEFDEQAKREAELREQADVAKHLIGSLLYALKPLQLQAIDLQNPGRHVTDLIAERDDLRREVERLKEEVDVGLSISGSFFEALKPLNLAMINVADPGSHVTELITEIAALREAGEREAELREHVEVLKTNCEIERETFEADQKTIADLRREVERLKESTAVVLISRLRNQYDEQVQWNDDLRAEIADLKAEVERVTHDAVYHRVKVEEQKEEIAGLTADHAGEKAVWLRDFNARLVENNELRRENGELKAKLAPPINDGQTHYEGCWKDRGHHACALAKITEIEKKP